MFRSKCLRVLGVWWILGWSACSYALEWGRANFNALGLQAVIESVDAREKQHASSPGIEKGKFYTLQVRLNPIGEAKTPVFDGKLELEQVAIRMPEHGHGMMGKASITPTGVQQWQVTPVKLHMDGRWEITLDLLVTRAGVTQKHVGKMDLMLAPPTAA